MFQFDIQKDLRDRWFLVIIQHLNLFLMPLRSHFGSATVYLYSLDEKAGGATAENEGQATGMAGNNSICTCAIRISGLEKVACHNRDPLIAIAQAMARTRRTLTRQLRIKESAGL